MEQLMITIKNGTVEIEVKGARGTRCLGLTQALENLIGKVDDRLLKDEYYKTTNVEQKNYLIHLKNKDPSK